MTQPGRVLPVFVWLSLYFCENANLASNSPDDPFLFSGSSSGLFMSFFQTVTGTLIRYWSGVLAPQVLMERRTSYTVSVITVQIVFQKEQDWKAGMQIKIPNKRVKSDTD